MVILTSCGSHGEKLKIQQPDNAKYVKRRKVFVVRDFPNGFDKFRSTQTNRISNESLNSVGSDDDLFDRIYVDSDLEDDDSEPFEIDVSMSLEQMIESDQEETLELGANFLNLFHDSEFIDQLETPERESTDLLNDVLEDVAHTQHADWAKTYFPRRTVFAVRSFPPRCGRGATHLSNDNGLDGNKSSVENEPFATRVSAIRFFPPGCGRNAIYPSKEDSEKALDSSKNKGTCHKECFTKQAPRKKPIKNHFPLASSSNIESERIDTIKNRVKPTCSSNLYQSQIKSQPVNGIKDGEVEDSSKKPKKELTKTKLSRVSTKMSELQGKRRVIVLALMAAPRCPSRKGKPAFKTQLK